MIMPLVVLRQATLTISLAVAYGYLRKLNSLTGSRCRQLNPDDATLIEKSSIQTI